MTDGYEAMGQAELLMRARDWRDVAIDRTERIVILESELERWMSLSRRHMQRAKVLKAALLRHDIPIPAGDDDIPGYPPQASRSETKRPG